MTAIKDWIKDNDITVADLSRKIGVDRQRLNPVINGDSRLTPELAAKLQTAGIPALDILLNQVEQAFKAEARKIRRMKRAK